MEIKVRNVDPVAVKKIDELAKEKGISRQEFFKGQMEMLAFFREQTTRELHLENLKGIMEVDSVKYAREEVEKRIRKQRQKRLNRAYFKE
ncbi:hypothetical protein [Priestia endophytica]|uniref:hypothetical protein n=1 Tax=Priestia endophytica TaxID=135735 RepID=UPI002041AAB8|nr:hypothetical protein [Priestia endophytica]MCM3541161.1 hypothetical protein [Priestia endophytica]